MISIKKILVATDFSEGSEASYPIAQKVASTFGSQVDLLHVIPTAKYLNESLKKIGFPVDMSKDVYPKIQQESEEKCMEALNAHFPEQMRGRYDVKIDRKPSEVIVDHGTTNGYDLIVIGTRGSHDTRKLRGGTAERVIRNSTVPVFCVDPDFSSDKLETILVPTDLSPVSLSAFPLAAVLAGTYGAKVLLYHVMELYGMPDSDIQRDFLQGEEVSTYESLVQRVRDYLSDYKFDSDIQIERDDAEFEDHIVVRINGESKTIPLQTKIEKGISAHYEIERFTREHADLIVMATHGHSGFAHFILGSTAEKVIQNVNRPVITVRPSPEQLRGE